MVALPGAAAFAGCGGDGGSGTSFTGPDPATMAPAGAPLFAEAVVHPEGDQKEELDSALSKLLATDDPGGLLSRWVDGGLATAGNGAGIDFTDDVEPWLGERAGAFLTGSQRGDRGRRKPSGALVVSTTDPAATQRTIDRAEGAGGKSARARSYEGFEYRLERDGDAAGIVGDFLVVGDEAGFKAAVDASRGESLAESAAFKDQFAELPDDAFGFLYAEPQGLVDTLQAAGEVTAAQVRSAGPEIRSLLSQPVAASVSASADQLSLQTSAASSSVAPAPQESDLLRSFPADAWLAFAASDAGRAYAQGLAQGDSTQLSRKLGLDLGSLSHWAGDIGGFVGGTSLFGLSGALVLETDDEQASAQSLGQLQRALRRDPALQVEPLTGAGEQGFSISPGGIPVRFEVLLREGKVVAGLPGSVDDVFDPGDTLADSDAFNAATDALGEDFSPVGFIDFQPLFQLVNGFPQAQSDPDYQNAKPYLDHLNYLTVGGREDQGRAELKTVLGLRDSAAEATDGSSAISPAVVAR
jgi:uncharacterized protein DUF3352